jgi:hypothetical protein
VASPGQGTPSTGLFVSWKNRADTAGEPTGPQKRFSQKLEERGFENTKDRNGWAFAGLRLITSGYGGYLVSCDACGGSTTYRRHARANNLHATTRHMRHVKHPGRFRLTDHMIGLQICRSICLHELIRQLFGTITISGYGRPTLP